MNKYFIEDIKRPGFELQAWAEEGRCDADGCYWAIRIDGGIYSDGYTAFIQDAIDQCRETLKEYDSKSD